MKKVGRRILAIVLALIMVANTAGTYLPSMQTLAAPITKTMSHLVAGTSNGNGHFGGSSPEAFVLSNKSDIGTEGFSFTMKLGSELSATRFRFVTKYQDDDNWAYIACDPSGWLMEYKYEGTGSYGSVTLPTLNKNDVIKVSGSYTEEALKVTIKNETQGTNGTAEITDSSFLAASKLSGQIGYGAAGWGADFTDVYIADTTIGEEALSHSDFTAYSDSAEGYTWESVDNVTVGDDGQTDSGDTDTEEPSGEKGRKWVKLQGGSNNTTGHNYGNASSSGPLYYKDSAQTMKSGGTISLALKPSSNWGVFYSYIDDDNWLYVGHDNNSKWYYQYRLNGSESYPAISGLPEMTEGEEMTLSISLSQETLSVTVNDTTVRVTNQDLISYASTLTSEYGNMGSFGVMTKGATQISFADFKYNNVDCMNDTWAFQAERTGQTATVTYTALMPVSGKVTDESGNGIAGATVRVGKKSAKTAEDGTYQISGVQVGDYTLAVSKAGYEAYTKNITVAENAENIFAVTLSEKQEIDLTSYDTVVSDDMTVYIGKDFPVVARYVMNSDRSGKTFFRGNETSLRTVVINGTEITPSVKVKETKKDSRTYTLTVKQGTIDFTMDVQISVKDHTLTWKVTDLTKNAGCTKIKTIDLPELNLLSVDAVEAESVFAGAQASTETTKKADTYITFDDGFTASETAGYLYAFLTNGSLSAGLDSNSEIEGDKRVERVNGADSMSLTSAVWYYEAGDETTGQSTDKYDYPLSELPEVKVAIAEGDLNNDGDIDWNDGAIAFREIMHTAQGSDAVKDLVNYRIVMNFESAAPNPFLATADNLKKVYLATDGLPQALLLKGYGNEGHDSANSEYADVAEREGGIEDFQDLIRIAHDYNTQVGIHVNAQEAYPEARSFNETMVSGTDGSINGNGWGWLDQSVVINKLWDLSSDARLKRLVQLYDRINGTRFYSGDWEKKEYVKDSQGFFTNGDGKTEVSREKVIELIKADSVLRKDNMDFIYLDVWYQDSWETRRIAEEFNSLGWRFSTEFSAEGEYDSTWQHWSTDTTYGGAGAKGYNSDIIRFLRNDLRDSQVLNWPEFKGTADNPLLGGFRLYGFEGWGGQQDFNAYIEGTFNENVPTKFLQHYEIIDWENYDEGESPVGNTEKQITLKNGNDVVVVTRNEGQRDDIEIERQITLNGKVVLNTDTNESTYLLPWTDNQNGEEKLYHWNLDGGTTTWELQDAWANLANVVVYELSDQGRINEKTVKVSNGSITLEAKASTAYVVVKGEEAKVKTLKNDFGEYDYVVDPGFHGYADGAALDSADWSGDIDVKGVTVKVSDNGDQRLEMANTDADAAVTTKISGLTKGEHYVAEVYVANEGDTKAEMSVRTGKKTVSNYTMRSIAQNYISCDPEHGSNMQRMQVSFVAESQTATLTLSREGGEGYTHWDDIRIVAQEVDNFKEDGSFEQDFESVVQGLYPFVLGYNAGGDSRTHLSQLNAPYTQKGWNGKAVDDAIEGEWSLKHHANTTNVVYRTIPQNFRFEAGKLYQVEFDYQTASSGYQMIVGDGTSYTAPTTYLAAATETAHVSMQVAGSGSGQTWIGLYMNGSLCGEDTSTGDVDFILDNLKITEVKDAKVVTVSATELFLGEMADIYGSSMDELTWTTSKEGVVEIDKENAQIKAVGAGEATVTAKFADGKTTTFQFVVTDKIAVDIDRSEYPDISASANTEQTSGEGEGNGVASATVDGDSSTYWHSNWSNGFSVSESNPAILTVDLGKELSIGGFKFQQRNQSNRVIKQFSYEIQNAKGEKVASKEHLTTDAGAWEWDEVLFDKTVQAQKIILKVEVGSDNFACLAEIAPIRVWRAATKDHVTVTVKKPAAEAVSGTTAKFETTVTVDDGYLLKGLTWVSSDESVATVSQYGVITYRAAGTVTLTLKNALGEYATHTVTVTQGANPPDNNLPDNDLPDDTPTGPKYYTVTVASGNTNMGITGISPVASNNSYEEYTDVTVTAYSYTNYHFVGWKLKGTNEILSDDRVFTLSVTENMQLIAVFEADVTEVKMDSITIGWEKPELSAEEENDGKYVAGYYVSLDGELQEAKNQKKTRDVIQNRYLVTDTSYTFTGLTAGTSHKIYVAAVLATDGLDQVSLKTVVPEKTVTTLKESTTTNPGSPSGGSDKGNGQSSSNNTSKETTTTTTVTTVNRVTDQTTTSVKTGDTSDLVLYAMCAVLALTILGYADRKKRS